MLPPAREMMSYLRILETNLREVSQRRPLLATRAFSLLKAATISFTFYLNLLKHYAQQALKPTISRCEIGSLMQRSSGMYRLVSTVFLSPLSLMILVSGTHFHVYSWVRSA